jgi:hypothetical protein
VVRLMVLVPEVLIAVLVSELLNKLYEILDSLKLGVLSIELLNRLYEGITSIVSVPLLAKGRVGGVKLLV